MWNSIIRQELQGYFGCCERLLASSLVPDYSPFSPDELMMMSYYTDQIGKIVDSQMHVISEKPVSEGGTTAGVQTPEIPKPRH